MTRASATAICAASVLTVLCAGAQAQDAIRQPGRKQIGKVKPEVEPALIVMNSAGARLEGNKLALMGIAPNSIIFADRPVRAAGHALTAHLLEEWAVGSDSFAKDPPNATVSVFDMAGSSVKDAVVTLKNPKMEGSQLTFDVALLEGDLGNADGPASVFIDIIGMPFTPLSFAGMARRTAYRGAFYAGAAAAAAGAYGYYHPYAPPAGKVDPSIDMKTAVRDQVNRMDAVAYFTLLAELMKTNPPSAADAPALAKFARIGLVPGQDFDASKLRADFARRIPEIANDRIMIQFKINKDVHDIDGWGFTTKTGIYGTDYLMRALVTAIGLGANRPQDAVYPTSLKDGDGRAYDGANRYVMRFAKGQLPPVEGFWSLTMYDGAYFFVPNPINRYSVSARQDLKANPDGSVDLYIQKDSPGADKESNWLPAPAGKFILMLRMYWPDESNPSIIDGTWTIPPVRKVADRA